MIPNHPEIRRTPIGGLSGPPEKRDRIIIVKQRGEWHWRYKCAGETHYALAGSVRQLPTFRQVFQAIATLELVADIL